MKKQAIRKLARVKINEGYTKQDTFAELQQIVDMPVKELAKIVMLTPTLQSRRKYRTLNYVLMVIFASTVILKMFYINTITVPLLIKYFSFIRPVIGIFILLGIDRFRMGCQRVAAVYTFTGTFTTIDRLFNNETSLLMYVYLLSAIITICMGLYLSSKLYPKFISSKEKYIDEKGTESVKNMIRFND